MPKLGYMHLLYRLSGGDVFNEVVEMHFLYWRGYVYKVGVSAFVEWRGHD